jgi:hypothetical protein
MSVHASVIIIKGFVVYPMKKISFLHSISLSSNNLFEGDVCMECY